MDSYNSQLDRPKHIPDRMVEAKDAELEERLVEFIKSLPDAMQAFIRAKLMEQDSGEMPMPPGMGMPMPGESPMSFTPPLP